MGESAVHLLSATTARDLFARRALSPVEMTQAVLAQAEATQGTVNAFFHIAAEQAMAAAREAERRYVTQGSETRALEGICVALKDVGGLAGWPTSFGSLTASLALRTTTTPENETVLRAGATRNPHNLALTPGGSSGGAAASVAIGAATLAMGSDIGGSIRAPASCCGVVGYKPPRGRNPVTPPFNLDFYCHTGPIARTVADALMMQNAISGPHPGDVTTLHPKLELTAQIKPLKGLRVAYSLDLGFFEIDPEVVHNTMAALRVFEACGATVTPVELPWDWQVIETAKAHLARVFSRLMAEEAAGHEDALCPYTKTWIDLGSSGTAETLYAALSVAGRMGVEFSEALAGHDIFVCPTTALPAVPAEFDHSRDTVRINGTAVEPVLGWALTAPFNMLSSHPVTSVPSGVAANNCPSGIQIVAKPYQDQAAFDAALAYEAELSGFGSLLAPAQMPKSFASSHQV